MDQSWTNSSRRLRVVMALMCSLALFGSLLGTDVVLAGPAQAAGTDLITDSPNGSTSAVAVAADGTTYVGGSFTSVGPNTGGGAAVDSTSGIVNRAFPGFNSSVLASASDGAGGWYVGGSFTSVNGVPRNRAARILANGTVDPRWNPNISGNVNAIAVSGTTIYLAGSFSGANSVNGTLTRNRAAAVDATTGTATAWDPNLSGTVSALAISGTTVYLGGAFSGANSVNGTLTRNRAAAVNATTGTATDWNPNLNGNVAALAISGDTVYLGGTFNGANSVNGTLTRNRAAAVDTATGTATDWNPNLNSTVNTLVISDDTVYLGGAFNGANSINGTLTRNRAAAVHATTGIATAWDPNVGNTVTAIAISGTTAYLGGTFTSIGAAARNRAGAVSTSGVGAVQEWDPNIGSTVQLIAVSGSTVLLGGGFTHVNVVTRNRAAAFGADGRVTNWDPNVGNTVTAIAISGGTVYLGGTFTTVGSTTTRNRAAAVDATTGTATAWDPNLNNSVNTLAISGGTVYLGGTFTTVGSTTTRNRAAAVDAATGAVTAWDPNLNDAVNTIAIAGTTVYLGGTFTTVGATTNRSRIAAVEASTGAATSWDAGINTSGSPAVRAIAVSGTTVYFVGFFQTVGGTQRNSGAAVTTAGVLEGWNPRFSNSAFGLALGPSSAYVATASPGVVNNLLTPQGSNLAKLTLSGANPAQPASAAVSGATLTWDIPLYGGVAQYYVMYRQQGATYPWAIYATGLNSNNPGVALDNPGTRNTCSATNTAMGYTSCPMVRGWTPGVTYELAVVTRTTEGKNSLNPIKTLTTYTVPAR